MRIALLSEGTSEHALLPHLATLCVRAGLPEAEEFLPDFGLLQPPPGKTVAARLQVLDQLVPGVDIVFVHRDSDAKDPERRYTEIARAATSWAASHPVVGIVPVRMLESWLLTDEQELFRTVGRQRGDGLELPKNPETIADPKRLLAEKLLEASGTSGRRRRDLATPSRFSNNRRFLLQNLDLDGPITQLTSWKRMVDDIESAVSRVLRHKT